MFDALKVTAIKTKRGKVIIRAMLVTIPIVLVVVWVGYSQSRSGIRSPSERESEFRKSLAAYSTINESQLSEGFGPRSDKEKRQTINLSFNTLKSWTYVEHKTAIPDYIKNLDGQSVQMAGFMMPLNATKQISEFVLVQFLWGCCFGQPPAANHVVLVTMADGKRTQFFTVPVCVRGTFHAGEMRQDGYLVSLYRLEAKQVTECR